MNSVANVRTRDYIIKNIREQILSGNFPAGMRLAQEELAEALGVSRIPVREALQILEEQGLAERLPTRHMVVAEITKEQFRQIYQTIGVLQYQYGGFILESQTREAFLQAISLWDGRNEVSFHRLFADWLDNGYLSRQFYNLLDTYVEYACGLQNAGMESAGDGGGTTAILKDVRQAYIQEQKQEVPGLFALYYRLLEDKILEERTRHTCRD